MPTGCNIRISAQEDYLVGSGAIEAGCKSVTGSRLKRSGMFRTA